MIYENCESCELCGQNQTTCIGYEPYKAKVMWIQECPNELDDKKNQAFSGKSCNAVKRAMESRGINLDEVYFTSLVKCMAPDEEPKPVHVKTCQSLLSKEIEEVDPDIIIPTGNKSMRFCGIKGTITKVRGNAQEIELLGRKRIVLPTMHPRSVLRKPLYKDYILKDMDTLKDLYFNGMTESADVNYRYLETKEECFKEFRRMKKQAKILSFDIETTGKSAYMDWSKIVCISLTDKTHYGVTIPLYKHDTPMPKDDLEEVVVALRELLEDPSIPKVAHNGKFDIEWLDWWLKIDVAAFSFDTMLAHYLCISEEQGTQGLKSQAWEFTDMGGYDNALDEYRDKLSDGEGVLSRYNYDRIPWEILREYAAADVDCCLRLYEIYKPLIDANENWKTILYDIMMPGSYTLRTIEENGMKFDVDLSDKYLKSYKDEIDRITSKLESYPEVIQLEKEKQALYAERQLIMKIPPKERTDEEKQKFKDYQKYKDYKFNWNSTAQLAELLYDRLGLVTSIKTDTGNWSTGEEALIEIKNQHEVPSLLLERKKVVTLYNMFITVLPKMRDGNDIVHSSFNISGTVTGRMSSENPNFQQLPRKAEDPTLFQYQNEPKALFRSRFGKNGCIMNADYSALEMRVAAIISKDKALKKALQSGADLHKSTASLVWGVPVDEVPKDMRTAAKSVNFGIIYGKSGNTFARDLYYDPSGKDPKKTADWDKAKKEGNKLVNDYLNTFYGLKEWLENTKKFAYKEGHVETMFGRWRRLPDLKSKVDAIKANAERQSINAPIQGTGADFTMLSLIGIQKWLTENNKKSLMIATVHDSIVFDVYIPELAELARKVKEIMESVHKPYIETEIPVRADLELGEAYGSVFEVELDETDKILTRDDFENWNHEKKIKKYQKEIKTFHDKGWGWEDALSYMKKNNRPVKELQEFLIETYSPEEDES